MRNSPGVEYRQHYLGMFDTSDETRAARLPGERLFHKQYARKHSKQLSLPPDFPAARHDPEFEVNPFLADLVGIAINGGAGHRNHPAPLVIIDTTDRYGARWYSNRSDRGSPLQGAAEQGARPAIQILV
jgi:hypothetical protein